jgi:hypothetical protein
LPSCDQAKPFHFSIKQDAVDDEPHGGDKRDNGTGAIDRLAHSQINPDAIAANTEREQGREDDENDMKTFDRH